MPVDVVGGGAVPLFDLDGGGAVTEDEGGGGSGVEEMVRIVLLSLGDMLSRFSMIDA